MNCSQNTTSLPKWPRTLHVSCWIMRMKPLFCKLRINGCFSLCSGQFQRFSSYRTQQDESETNALADGAGLSFVAKVKISITMMMMIRTECTTGSNFHMAREHNSCRGRSRVTNRPLFAVEHDAESLMVSIFSCWWKAKFVFNWSSNQ